MILSLNRTKVPVYGETKCLVINKNKNNYNHFDSSNSVIYYTHQINFKSSSCLWHWVVTYIIKLVLTVGWVASVMDVGCVEWHLIYLANLSSIMSHIYWMFSMSDEIDVFKGIRTNHKYKIYLTLWSHHIWYMNVLGLKIIKTLLKKLLHAIYYMSSDIWIIVYTELKCLWV